MDDKLDSGGSSQSPGFVAPAPAPAALAVAATAGGASKGRGRGRGGKQKAGGAVGAVMAAAYAKLHQSTSTKSDGNSQYFPKGTGYGSGTPAQKWNFQQVRLMRS